MEESTQKDSKIQYLISLIHKARALAGYQIGVGWQVELN